MLSLHFQAEPGRWKEITEVMSKVSLRHLTAPCILYNLNGYYDSLRNLLEHMIEKGLSSKDRQKGSISLILSSSSSKYYEHDDLFIYYLFQNHDLLNGAAAR